MANKLQRDAFRRRVSYGVAIFALFLLSMVWRGKVDLPLSSYVRGLAVPRLDGGTLAALNRGAVVASKWVVESPIQTQADRLELSELNQGDPEIAGETARLAFVGARGIVVTMLWTAAIEKQKRNEFDEFEILARAVTTLQPHFITPWVFQSWNIAYNVSVETDKLGDMYFYIAHGIELLAEGDRRNSKKHIDDQGVVRKVGSPDMRYQIGFYYQNKFSVSDKVNTLRSLMQLSCIKPPDRARSKLQASTGGDRRTDADAFRRFCEANPQLVRRLRAKLFCDQPSDVIDFLAANEKIPTLFGPEGELLGPSEQFPILPEYFAEGPNEYFPGKEVDDGFDAFHAARAWFLYSLPVIPPAKRDRDGVGDPLPWRSPKPGEYDASRYRMPRSPSLVIFRQQGARAQTYLATRLAEEGWFDSTSAWEADENAGPNSRWFPAAAGSSGEPVLLRARGGSQPEWQRAFDMWDEHGERNAMKLSDARRAAIAIAAGLGPNGRASGLNPELPDSQLAELGLTRAKVEAHNALVYYDQNRTVTNYAYFLETANAEKDAATVQARKLFWEADQARLSGRNNRAVELYRTALAQWRQVLATYKDFHRPGSSEATEEATYENELKLLGLLKEDGAVRERARRVAEATAALLGPIAARAADDVVQAVVEDETTLQIAAESLTNVYPGLGLSPDDPRDQAVRRANATLAGSGAFGGAFGAPEVVRAVVARGVIASSYPWLKEFKTKPLERDAAGLYERSAYWVRPELKESIKARLGLVRKLPVAAPPAPPGDGTAPPG